MAPALLAALLAAAGPALVLRPDRVRPGDALLVTVLGAERPPEGTVGARALVFYPVPGGFRALAALPIEAEPGQVPVDVTIPAAPGGAPGHLEGSLRVEEPGFPSRELGVAPRFVEPPPAARRRMARDQGAFRRAFAQEPSPPLFAANFAWPRRAELTARYGDRRLFNGKKRSQHYGDDIQGATGDPVAAANDGRVVLVRDCYASGRSVVVWHGAGLYSVYFHLSRFLVHRGDEVRRGQLLGRVGRSGRVTGPHLHWGMKLGDLYVDPESVLRLDFAGNGDLAPPAPAAPAEAAGPVPPAPVEVETPVAPSSAAAADGESGDLP